jgi:hypothetical protein
MTAIWASSVRAGMWIDPAGYGRCQVTKVGHGAGGARLWLRREDGTRTSMARPLMMVQLADDQGRCADCLLPLVPGADEEADQYRATGHDGRARYFCGSSADALHHPEGERR